METQGKGEDVPEGWISVTIPEICDINPKKPPIKSILPDTPVTFVPMPAVDADQGAITNPEIRKFKEVRNGFTFFQEGDVIFAKITPCMENGKAAIARNLMSGMGFGSTEFFTLRSNGSIIPEYLYHYIRQESFRKEAEENMTGSVGQKRVPKHFIENSIIPLSPLAEQRRIVDAVEALLTRVNASRERLDRVPGLLKAFRQAVLAAACSGRLTEGWREGHPNIESAAQMYDQINLNRLKKYEQAVITAKQLNKRSPKKPEYLEKSNQNHNNLPDKWIWTKVRNLGFFNEEVVKTGPFGAILKSKEFISSGVPIIAIGNVQWGKFDLNRVRVDHVSERKASELSDYRVKAGDVLFTRSGTIGRSLVVPNFADGWLMSYHLLRVRADPNIIDSKYLYYIFSGCEISKEYTSDSIVGSTRPGINTTILENMPIPLPPLPEQNEIIHRVEALFAFADRIEQRVAAGRDKADRLTQAILAKAFRGELVPIEAELARSEGREYEPAGVLLERVKVKIQKG
jgi:type I restriction enzyme S subunit